MTQKADDMFWYRKKDQPIVRIVSQAGFSLVEMAVVLVIIGIMLGGLLLPLSSQVEQQRITETRKILEQAREALMLYAASNGRLPCPANATSNGTEAFAPLGGNATNGICANPWNGFLPAVTLGFQPIDREGFAVDGWSLEQNRIRYSVFIGQVPPTGGTINPFTSTNGMRTAGMATLAANPQLISVCRTNSNAADCGGVTNQLTLQAPFLVFSLGKNAPTGGTGVDEAQNLNGNSIFVSHETAASTAPNGEFDDILVWASLHTLFARMLAAGSLP